LILATNFIIKSFLVQSFGLSLFDLCILGSA
jgi:hypothetical protein